MNIHANLKNEGKSRKNYKPRGGVEVRSILRSYGLLNACQIVEWDPLNAKRSSLQNILVWAMRKCMVSMASPHTIFENGGRPTNSIISRILLILEH